MAFAGGIGTAFAPFRGQWRDAGAKMVHIAPGNGTSGAVVAAATGKRHVIIAGSLSAEGADTIRIVSTTTALATMEFTAAGTLNFPVGLETATSASLELTGDAVNVVGWIVYATISDGQYQHIP